MERRGWLAGRRPLGHAVAMAGVLATEVWIVGGNTFVLRRVMALSGLDAVLRERAEDDWSE